MSNALSSEELAAAKRTAAAIGALRSESRRLAAEQRDLRGKKRRRENVVKAYREKGPSV
ncbi:hypothetical protein [Solicola gregarius]|uniref:Uncharacterized protein n=1 Tax=Solicola gregarius TaxID=2908642 RepID=A0AA46TJ50_9ACTN|nr:hypothetical protein [Solicola gregarius]UYM06078.1 hypothetical protein L0C25_03115 [Solicola gregarius]